MKTALAKPNGMPKPPADVPSLSAELRDLQRKRSIVIKSRIMQANRLQAVVAGTLGYEACMPEKERLKKFTEASALIAGVDEGTASHPLEDIIRSTLIGIKAFNHSKEEYEKAMKKVAKQLPVAGWVEQPEQRGFGVLFLAIVIGETGDLNNYANPAKVWRRLGCAPWTFDGKTQMGATWRGGKGGKLSADEWEKFGYSPRRRSIAYLIGEGIVKQNGGGPYRERYLGAKVRAHETHKEDKGWNWRPCDDCKGKAGNAECPKCGGTGQTCLRAHRHGMLLATKLLLKNLWIGWRN